MSNQSPKSSYSNKYKHLKLINQSKDMHPNSPKARIILQPLTPKSFKNSKPYSIFAGSPQKKNFNISPLTKVIDDKSIDYESAIKQYIRANVTSSRQSDREEFSPMTKIIKNAPYNVVCVTNKSPTNSMKSVEIQEKRVQNELMDLDTTVRKIKQRGKNNSEIPGFDLNELKLGKLKSSIEDMRVLLKKMKK